MKSKQSSKTRKMNWATSIQMLDWCRWGLGSHLPINGDHNNFAPRLGLAWDVFGNGKTVVRAAGGIVYESAVTYDVTNAVSNFLGLRTIPTGIPLYNNGSSTPIRLHRAILICPTTTYTGSTGIGTIATNWQTFDPTQPISSTNKALYAGATSSVGCGDGFTVPTVLQNSMTAPPPCSIVGIDPQLSHPLRGELEFGDPAGHHE